MGFEGLRQVAEFMPRVRPLIRSMKNPLDKCTIVSIFPKEIREVNYTISPGAFNIPAGSFDKPSTLLVGPSSWWKDIDAEQPMIEIPVSSIQVAESVIKDYSNGLVEFTPDAMPGLFFALGECSVKEIKDKHSAKLLEAKTKQDNWFRRLVRLADSLWARTNGNPIAIPDETRMAARMLGLEDKPWLKDFIMVQMVPCVACGGLRNPTYPICPSCKTIDMTNPLAKDLKFAV